MTIWRQVFEPDLTSTLSLSEIDAFRKSSAETDPIESQIHDTVAYVRGIIRSSPAKVALDPDELTLPESLIRPAMDYLRFNVLTRCNLVVNESRTKTYEKACEILEMIRKGEFVPESAANATADVAGVAGSPTFATATPSRLLDAILFIVALGCTFSASAIDLKWTCNAPETRAESFTAYHGETVTFSPTFKAYGLPASVTANMVFYQTNGMADAWWHTDGLVFAPSNDVGASSYRFFVAASDSTGTVYRANGILRMLPSPGFEPNVLQTPPRTIDFSKVQTLNAPWNGKLDQPAADARYLQLGGGTMTGSLWIPASQLHIGDALDYSFYGPGYITRVSAAGETIHYFRNDGMAHTVAVTDDIPTDEHITDLADAAASTKADAATVAALAQNVEVWTGVWKGDNSRVVITNYDSQVHLPEFSFELRTNEVDMATNLFRVVWREMAHWESFLGLGWDWEDPNWQGFGAWKSATEQAIAGKADRAWGYYDSHSGNYAPDGYTWISSPKIAIAGGLAYNKVLTTEGAVWVLESNGLVTETSGTESNGFFRISDDAGNSLFEIVKGDKRTVGATAGTVQLLAGFAITHLQVGYNVQSAEHPKIYVTDSLKPTNWKAEDDPDCVADVVWSGSSGAWIATVSGKVAMPAFFVQASYEVGGNTYIKQSAPVQMSKIVLGGVEYTLGTASIDGHTVLTLTP